MVTVATDADMETSFVFMVICVYTQHTFMCSASEKVNYVRANDLIEKFWQHFLIRMQLNASKKVTVLRMVQIDGAEFLASDGRFICERV